MTAVIVTLFILALISFWGLGYIHMRFQNQLSLETRRFKTEQNALRLKIEALNREKSVCEENIAALEGEISTLRESGAP